jgi:hypothetical protein
VARLFVEELGPGLPFLPDELSGREALEGLQSPSVVVGIEEQLEVALELVMVVVVVTLGRRVLDRPVHPLDLTIIRYVSLGASFVLLFCK